MFYIFIIYFKIYLILIFHIFKLAIYYNIIIINIYLINFNKNKKIYILNILLIFRL